MVHLVTSPGGVAVALRSLLAPGIMAARWLSRAPGDAGATRVPRSASLVAKMLLDEIFFMSEVISARLAPAADVGRVVAEVEAGLRLYERRGWLEDATGYHTEPPALDSWSFRPQRRAWIPAIRNLSFEHLAFPSDYEPHPDEPGRERWLGYTPVRTAHAWLLRHPGPPRPWLVCVHAYRMGFPLANIVAFPIDWLHRDLGINLAFPVLPLHGPRKIGRRTGDGVFSGEILDTIHMQAQAVWDLRRFVGWLRAQGAPTVGVYGLSLGGYTTALLAGLERRLDCVVAGVPHADYADLTRWNLQPLILRLADGLRIDWDALGRLFRVVSPLAVTPRLPREQRYLFAACADRLVPPAHARNLWLHWECPRATWYEGSHVSFGWEADVHSLLDEAFRATDLVAPSARLRATA